jgi:hypothetical protein
LGKPETGHLANRIKTLRDFEKTFGATKYVSEAEAKSSDENLVWHVRTEQDSSGWLNGFSTSDDPVDYWLAAKPWSGSPLSIYVITDEFFDCPECEGGNKSDPDDCEECEGYGCIVVDFEYVLSEKGESVSEAEIWAMRESQ